MRTTIEEQAEVLGHDMNTERVEPDSVDTPDVIAIQGDESVIVCELSMGDSGWVESDVFVEVEQ